MSSAGLISLRAHVAANNLTPRQQTLILQALDTVIPLFESPDDRTVTADYEAVSEQWTGLLYAIDAEGAEPIASSPQGSFLMKMAVLPEADGVLSLAELATSTANEPDQTIPPDTGLSTMQHVFLFPTACKLGTFRAFGSSALLATVNGRLDDLAVDLYVNGARVRTLVTILHGVTDFDLTDPGGDEFAAGDLVQFVIPIPASSVGDLRDVLFAFSVGPS